MAERYGVREGRIPSSAMAASSPLVSVLVTARDNERHVGPALRSVLRQTLRSLELLVVDDGSRDSTAAVIESLPDERLELTRHAESAGISVRRNELVERARGKYVAPLDADDVWFPERLERQVRLLEATPELVAAGSDVLVVDDVGRVGPYFRLPRSNAAVGWSSLFTSPLIHSASTIRTSAFHAGVRYDPAYPARAGLRPLGQAAPARARGEPPAAALLLSRAPGAGEPGARRRAPRRSGTDWTACDRGTWRRDKGHRALAWRLGAEADVPDNEQEEALAAYRTSSAIRRDASLEPGLREVQRIAAPTLLRRAGRGTGARLGRCGGQRFALDPTVSPSPPLR